MVAILGKINGYFRDFIETSSLAVLSAYASLVQSQN